MVHLSYYSIVKIKAQSCETEVPFDPVLFAATVPSRKPTAKDIADIKAHENDPIEPREYGGMDEMVEDL
jgi:hypothetical protein